MWGKALMMVLGTAGGDNVTPIRAYIEAPPPPPSIVAPAKHTEQQAVKEFFSECMAHYEASVFPLRRLRQSYMQLAPERGWPTDISDKAFAGLLKKCGCTHEVMDLRKFKQGRIAAYRFPLKRSA